MAADNTPPKDRLYKRWEALKSERLSWFGDWQDVAKHVQPQLGRYLEEDPNNLKNKYSFRSIYDSEATRALKVLSAGMMSGATSPARPWFKYGLSDPDLAKFHSVKLWLDGATDLTLEILRRSKAYQMLHGLYSTLGGIGTAPVLIYPNYETVVEYHPVISGEYCIATDYNNNVCTLYRQFKLRVVDMIKYFGYDNCSYTAQKLYNSGSLDTFITCMYVIEPREDRDIRKKDNKNMAFGSYYFEADGSSDNKFLRESGFPKFPGIVPRWATAPGDAYGVSPAMEAIGSIMQLQHQHIRKAQALDFEVDPPLTVPMSLKNQEINMLPGGLTFHTPMNAQDVIKRTVEQSPRIDGLLLDIEDVRKQIRSAFSVDMFLMLQGSEVNNMTATEVAEKNNEKLTMLGPVYERISDEGLEPLIEGIFDQAMNAGLLPPPPKELIGTPISVEFVSILAQAQKAVGSVSLERFYNNVAIIGQTKPEALDKVNTDALITDLADRMGIAQNIIVPDDEVAAIRKQRSDQMAQMQQQEAMAQQAEVASKLASAKTGEEQNALTDAIGMFSGYGGV